MKNTFVKVLSFMMALTMIVGAFGAITVSATECAHENRTEIAVVAPTCASAGFTRYECDDCGEEFIDGIKSATGKHTWSEVAATAATCDTPAYSAHKKCSVCNAVEGKTVVAPAKGHVYNIPYTQEATCTTDGFASKKCAVCDKIDDKLVADGGNKVITKKAAHKYIYTIVTAPTKCEDGTMKVTCSACDYTATIIEDEDHNWVTMTETTEIKAGTSCQFTYKSGKFCADCKAIHPESKANDQLTHNYVAVDFDTITATNLNAEIAALGYAIGDATNETAKANCTTVGYYLAQCTLCKGYVKHEFKINDGKGHKWNDWGAVTPADTEANHAVDKKQTRTCQNCDATETKVTKAATACTFTKEGAKVVKAATCLGNGYTTYTCDLCKVVTTGDVTYATGHNYGAVVYKSGNCDAGTAVYVQKCPNKDCEVPEKVATAPQGANACKWVKVTRAATCTADAYYEYECSVCKATKAYTPANANDKPAAGKDPANHVATATTSQLVQANVVAATCTNKAQNRYLCACGQLVDLEVGATPAHVKGTEYHKHTAAAPNTCTSACKSVAVKAATCKAVGIKTAGEICTVCGVVLKAPVVEEINAKNHVAAGVFVESAVATCAAKAYTTSYYSCCGKVDKIESGEKNPANHSEIKSVALVAATCTANGTAAHYKCTGCNKLYKDAAATTEVKAADLVIKNPQDDLKHNWNATAVAKVAETCTADGTKAYFTCKDCTVAIKIGEEIFTENAATTASELAAAKKIPAHKDQYMGWHKGVKATCTTDGYTIKGGYDAVYACSVCDKATVAKTNHPVRETTLVNAVAGGEYNCTLPTYSIVVCKVEGCGYTYFEDYKAAAKTAHTYAQETVNGVKVDKVTKPGTPDCTNAAKDGYDCTVCDYVDYRPGKAAIGHKINVNGVVIDVSFACGSADHKNYKGFKCVCGLTLGTEGDFEHSIISAAAKAPTCTEVGSSAFDYCKDCNKVFGKVEEIPATGHSANSTLIESVNGVEKYSCPVCGEFWTKSIVVVDTTPVVDTAIIAAGSEIKATIKVTASELTFNQLYIDVNAPVSDVEVVYDFDGNVLADVVDEYTVCIYTENDADGNAAFVTLDGEDVALVVVTIKVPEYAGLIGNGVLITEAEKALTSFEEDGDAVYTEFADNGKNTEITFATAGDLNGDAIIGISDVQKIITLVTNGSADPIADVNRDGAVDAFDVAALRKFIKAGNNAFAYVEMIGEDFDAAVAKVTTGVGLSAAEIVTFKTLVKEALVEADYTDYVEMCGAEDIDSLVDFLEMALVDFGA